MDDFDSPWGSQAEFDARTQALVAMRITVGRRLFQLQQAVCDARAALVLIREAIDGGRDLMDDDDLADDAAAEFDRERYREVEPILADAYDLALRDLRAFAGEHIRSIPTEEV